MTIDTRTASTIQFKVPADPIWQLRIEQYHQMIQTGILTDDDPVELLEGWLVTKMPKNPAHTLATQLTRDMLTSLAPAGFYVADQEPLTIENSEPEPDGMIVRGSRRDFRYRHPQPDDVVLVIEVSDATLQRDRAIKQRIYAQAGIPAYWIINLPDQRIECYTEPLISDPEPHYQQRQDYAVGDMLPLIIDEQLIADMSVADLLP